jgi:hypothetical protein
MASWSQGNSFTSALGLPFPGYAPINTYPKKLKLCLESSNMVAPKNSNMMPFSTKPFYLFIDFTPSGINPSRTNMVPYLPFTKEIFTLHHISNSFLPPICCF